MTGIRPKGLRFSEPRDAVRIMDVRREFDPSPLHLWTTIVRYVVPGGEVLNLNFSS